MESKKQNQRDAENLKRLKLEHKQAQVNKSQELTDLKIKVAKFFGGTKEGREIFTLLSLHYQSQQIADPEKTHAHACFNQGKLVPFKDIKQWIKQLNEGQLK